MTNKNRNIESWTGRILMLFFVLFLLSFSGTDSNTKPDCHSVSLEQVTSVHNAATIIEPAFIPDYSVSLVSSLHLDLRSSNFQRDLKIYSNIINQQFKIQEFRFFQFRPGLLKLHLAYLKLISNEDYLAIS